MLQFVKKHYHWVIAGLLFLMMGVRGGVSNNLAGLHLIPVTEALSITRAQFSMATSACFIVAMLATMFSGAIFSHFRFRTVISGLMLSGGAAIAIMGSAEQFWVFFAGYMLQGVTNGICAEAVTTRIVSCWFHTHKGTVLGAVSSATGLGGSIVCLIQTAIIQQSSYRYSLYFASILMVACGLLLLIFFRSHPADMGLLPYGDGEQVAYKKREHDDHWEGADMSFIVRRPAFYMMIFGTLLCCILPYLAFHVLVPHLISNGLSTTDASAMQSIMLLCLAGTKILAGYLCDAIGVRKVVVFCMIANIAGLILLTMATDFVSALIAVIVFVMALPCLTVVIPLLALSLFGYRSQAQYNGIFVSMVSAASIISMPISNGIYDRIGTYNPVFYVAAGIEVALIFVYLLMFRLANKDRKTIESQTK